MNKYMENRVLEVSEYILNTESTVRAAAKVFNYSKSTVYKDVTERLKDINPMLCVDIKAILNKHREERHIRGGIATRNKYKGVM